MCAAADWFALRVFRMLHGSRRGVKRVDVTIGYRPETAAFAARMTGFAFSLPHR